MQTGTYHLWLLLLSVGLVATSCTSIQPDPSLKLPGQEGHFSPPGAEAPVVTTEEALEDLNRAIAAQDKYGFGELFLTGRAFLVPQGTRVLVLDIGYLKTQIRILDGPNVGKKGWVSSEWVQ